MKSTDNKPLAGITLAALGVVYGDIGTSPLYTIKEVFNGTHHPVPLTTENVYGILSMILWSLVMVVTIKYVTFVMRADNKGEGGVMSLLALSLSKINNPRLATILTMLALFGASLFYGDSVITPAISILSAVEGIEIMTATFKPYVLPITIAILLILFSIQKHGTDFVGKLFGPIMFFWFSTLAGLGIYNIIKNPMVLMAINPYYAWHFIQLSPVLFFFSLGAVFLALTGAEALYADMGHFGRKPVQIAWLILVLPSLVLNYFGQGALILSDPSAIINPFYHQGAEWTILPLVILATMAAIIASQAVITGAFSVTQQAIQMGYLPRLLVNFTSSNVKGQIYIPVVNWGLMLTVIFLVLGFRSSSNLAAAYGIAVSGTMIVTTILVFFVARNIWQWSLTSSLLFLSVFLCIDAAFVATNSTKIKDGGWFPLVFGGILFLLMTTWKQGRNILNKIRESDKLPLQEFVDSLIACPPPVTYGTAIFLNTSLDTVPFTLLHSLKHYKVLHERVVFVSVNVADYPYIKTAERVKVNHLGGCFHQVVINYGFMDNPNVPQALELCKEHLLEFDMMDTTFFLGRETLVIGMKTQMAKWREQIFVTMYRNSSSACDFFKIPSNRVIELGSQVVL